MANIFKKIFGSKVVHNSNSQAGEDRVVAFLFDLLGIGKISYIDIGANHPIAYNNTYIFYQRGGHGVLIEPDPVFYKAMKRSRPKDTILLAAINDRSGEADFYIFDEPSLNTLSKEEAELRKKSGNFKLLETKKIKLLTIEDIIKDNLGGLVPHLISLDVEGVDLAVLKAFDFSKYQVPVWIVETIEYSEDHLKVKIQPIIDLMLSNGYFVFGDTYVNTIFVHKDWYHNYKKPGAQ